MSAEKLHVMDALQELLESRPSGPDPHGITVADALCHIDDSLRLLLHAYCLVNKLSFDDVCEAFYATIFEPKEPYQRPKKET
jgi:hypothetical protein